MNGSINASDVSLVKSKAAQRCRKDLIKPVVRRRAIC